MRRYLARISAWISQGFNCVVLFGHHDMTVSARCYINRGRTGWRMAYKLINWAVFWQDDHCRISFRADKEFARYILELAE